MMSKSAYLSKKRKINPTVGGGYPVEEYGYNRQPPVFYTPEMIMIGLLREILAELKRLK